MIDRQRPNLLYIHSDQHNPYVTGCYGDPMVRTPTLDRLAASGVVFENCYCPSPICVPSRMSVLTGRHPYQNEVWTNRHILDAGIPTFAHALGAAGYEPVLIGRMHALGPDQLHGYAKRLIGDHSPNHLGGSPVDRGSLSGTAAPMRVSLEKSGSGQNAYQVHDEYVAAAAVDYINRLGVQARSGQATEPFCLTVGFMLPHPPYVARRQTYDLYGDTVPLPRNAEPFSEDLHAHIRWWRQETGIEHVSEAEIQRARTAYWGLVTEVDTMIGRIFSALHENELADNTVTVYSSDHGDMVGEHGLWWKHVFYEESAKVPLIISWPGVIAPGSRCERVVSAIDLTASMLDALDAPPLPNSSGRSFLDLVTGKEAAWVDEAFSEYCSDEYGPPGGCYQRMVRCDNWKLVYYHDQPPQLFNLADDPTELIDRAQDPACQAVRQELTHKVLKGWDPDAIAAKMAAKRADDEILCAWAQHVQPPDQYRWDLRPEMNYLD